MWDYRKDKKDEEEREKVFNAYKCYYCFEQSHIITALISWLFYQLIGQLIFRVSFTYFWMMAM